MSHNQISVAIFGKVESLKNTLITLILGQDFSKISKEIVENIEIYKNDTYVITCAPDTKCEYKSLFSEKPHTDMCLVVVEKGFSCKGVQEQIEELSRESGKPADEFTVVLPLGYTEENYPFKSCKIQKVLNDLETLATNRGLTPTSMRPDDYAEFQMEDNGGRCRNNSLTDPKKNLKRKHTSTKVNLVLLGMAGTGKSASGNTILGKNVFMSKPSSNPVTRECQVEETKINGIHFRVIDTPDIFDDELKSSDKEKHVKRCKELCESEACVYVLVMHVSRFTDGERDILTKLEKAFWNKVSEKTVILFTRGNDLKQTEVTLEDFLNSSIPSLKEIIEKCGNRCVVFENNSSDSHQVKELVSSVMSVAETLSFKKT